MDYEAEMDLLDQITGRGPQTRRPYQAALQEMRPEYGYGANGGNVQAEGQQSNPLFDVASKYGNQLIDKYLTGGGVGETATDSYLSGLSASPEAAPTVAGEAGGIATGGAGFMGMAEGGGLSAGASYVGPAMAALVATDLWRSLRGDRPNSPGIFEKLGMAKAVEPTRNRDGSVTYRS